jgi:hypothetical protein
MQAIENSKKWKRDGVSRKKTENSKCRYGLISRQKYDVLLIYKSVAQKGRALMPNRAFERMVVRIHPDFFTG